MELNTFILTLEDFLEGSLEEDFLKEEVIYFKEELNGYSDEIKDEEENHQEVIELIKDGLCDIQEYFKDKIKNILPLKTGLEKMKKASFLIKQVLGEEEVEEEHLCRSNFQTKNIFHPPEILNSEEELTKSKIPPRTYYDKPKDIEEQIEFISDPVDSPLYTLLLAYQELELKKIDFNIWQEKLIEGEEELNYLLDKIDEVYDTDMSAKEMRIYILEAIGIIEEMDYSMSESNVKADIYIDKIRDLNLAIYNLSLHFLPEMELDIHDSILEGYEKLEEDDFKTANYLLVENDLYDFLEDLITDEQFLKSLKRMRILIENAMEQYETLPVSEEELTLEVFRGDMLMREGRDLWICGLDIIEDSISLKDKEGLLEGLDYIFNGNKKLVLLQYFSAQIERQAQIQKGFKDNL